MITILALSFLAAMQDGRSPTAATTNTTAAAPVTASTTPAETNRRIDEAADAIKNAKPADAIVILDGVIAAFDKSHPANPDVMVFSASNLTQTLMYSTLSATQKKSGIVVDGSWAAAHFLKGFALVDLNRSDEALSQFDRAIALSPMNAHFLAERGEWYKSHKQWDKAFDDFQSAATHAAFADPADQVAFKGRGLRGMAFVMIEKGDLKRAQKLLKEALKLNPNDAGARHELDYIKGIN